MTELTRKYSVVRYSYQFNYKGFEYEEGMTVHQDEGFQEDDYGLFDTEEEARKEFEKHFSTIKESPSNGIVDVTEVFIEDFLGKYDEDGEFQFVEGSNFSEPAPLED